MSLSIHDIDREVPEAFRRRILPARDPYKRTLVMRRKAWRAFRLYGLLGTLCFAVVAVGILNARTKVCAPGFDMVLMKSGRVVECR